METLLKWLDEHVTKDWQIGPVQFVVYVAAILFVITEIIRRI
jgi:hypothetical protein